MRDLTISVSKLGRWNILFVYWYSSQTIKVRMNQTIPITLFIYSYHVIPITKLLYAGPEKWSHTIRDSNFWNKYEIKVDLFFDPTFIFLCCILMHLHHGSISFLQFYIMLHSAAIGLSLIKSTVWKNWERWKILSGSQLIKFGCKRYASYYYFFSLLLCKEYLYSSVDHQDSEASW